MPARSIFSRHPFNSILSIASFQQYGSGPQCLWLGNVPFNTRQPCAPPKSFRGALFCDVRHPAPHTFLAPIAFDNMHAQRVRRARFSACSAYNRRKLAAQICGGAVFVRIRGGLARLPCSPALFCASCRPACLPCPPTLFCVLCLPCMRGRSATFGANPACAAGACCPRNATALFIKQNSSEIAQWYLAVAVRALCHYCARPLPAAPERNNCQRGTLRSVQ